MQTIDKLPLGTRPTIEALSVRAFLAVIRLGNLSKASEQLLVAQSTISHRLSRLETAVGARLIDRSRGQHVVALTGAGEEFLHLAQRWESLMEEFGAIGRESWIRLSVGSIASVNQFLLPDVFADIVKTGILKLRLVTASSSALYMMMARDEIDMAIVGEEYHLSDNLLLPILDEPLVLISKNRELVNPKGGLVHPSRLDPYEEVYLNWGPEFTLWHRRHWPHSVPPVEVDSAALALPFLADRRRWAIVPQSMAFVLMTSEAYLSADLMDPPPARILYLAHKRRIRNQAKDAIDLLMKHVMVAIGDFGRNRNA